MEKFYPYEQTQLKKSYVRPASPRKPHPFTNQANISPSYFPKPGKALMQLLPSHTPLLSNPDGTQHRTTCCVTQLKEEKIDSHSNAGDAVQMEQNTSARHTHTCTHARKEAALDKRSTSSLKQGLCITPLSAVTK